MVRPSSPMRLSGASARPAVADLVRPRTSLYRRWALVACMLALWALPVQGAPEITEWQTEAGARVLFVQTSAVPMVQARVTFAAGSARDGEHPGIARLTSNLLMSGTRERDADALARALEDVGARVSTGSARDMGWVELRALAEPDKLQPAVEHVRELLAQPAFPAKEIARLKDQQRTQLQNRAQSPGAIASRRFWEAAYADHPYGHDPRGSTASLEAIDRAALQAFHERYYVAANATIALVGALEPERARRLVRTLIGGLPSGQAAPDLPPVPELEDDRTIREPFPSTQAHVVIGRPGVERGYAQWPALYVANHVLGGGGFTSRLFDEVRDQRGLVYSVSSGFSPMQRPGPFRIRLQTRGGQTQEALDVVRQVFDRFDADGPTASEIDDAVLNITGGFPLQVDSNSDLAGYLSMIGFYGLPTDYLQRFPDRVEAVGPGSAHSAFVEALGQRPRVTVVVGGDRADGTDDD